MGAFLDNTGLTKLVELIKGSLPTKATSSTIGLVKPDNSTITVDSDGVISSSGGGTTYTAGSGINIDANDVISRSSFSIGEGQMALFNSGNVPNFSFGETVSGISTVGALATALKAGKVAVLTKLYSGEVTAASINTEMGTNYIVRMMSYDSTNETNPVSNNQYPYNSTSALGTYSSTAAFILVGNIIYGAAAGIGTLKGIMGYNLQHIITVSNGTSLTSLKNHIQTINSQIASLNTAVPAAPTTDGNYVLKCVVSSGTPTYSWVSET